MRASDADRERVAAVLRRHYGAGRLHDDELERRLAKVLGARAQASAGHRAERVRRARGHRGDRRHGFPPIRRGLRQRGERAGPRGSHFDATPYSPPAEHITHVGAGDTAVDYANREPTTVEPFCVGGAKLYSRSHRGYEPFDRTYHAAGNRSVCGGGIEPEETATVHLPFDVPRGARFAFVDLYNSDEKGGDDLGNTRLRVNLDAIPGA